MKRNNLFIRNDGSMFLDDTRLKYVREYKLTGCINGCETLTITMDVSVGTSSQEPEGTETSIGRVDKTIDAICDWIQKELNSDTGIEKSTLTEMVKALAELMSARAND